MKNYRLNPSPRSLRRSAVHLDNITLVPASLLLFPTQWRAIAQDFPPGERLIVLPAQPKQQCVARSVAALLRENGQPVRVLPNEFLPVAC